MKRIVILGSTGSVGVSALDIVQRYPDRFQVVGLTAGQNWTLLEAQIRRFRPRVVALANKEAGKTLRARSRALGCDILEGVEGLIQAAALPEADLVLAAILGAAGLVPTVAAVRAGKRVALANKETLVLAGAIVMREAAEHGALILPVDSEHNAIFQVLDGRPRETVRRILLTASGGPFVDTPPGRLERVTPREALNHPRWKMGDKITIDSATMMNKGLEVMEARWLFGLPPEQIEVLLHPQSIVHSLVEFVDGSVIAQLGMPDMRGPIAHALAYPERLEKSLPPLNLVEVGALTFRAPDAEAFPCLRYAYEALAAGGTAPIVLNAANEVAVHGFLTEAIGFLDIPRVIRATLDRRDQKEVRTIEEVLIVDRWARGEAERQMQLLREVRSQKSGVRSS